jgi:NADPH:quinone reductase-like Zn-dependent oxidoreductase
MQAIRFHSTGEPHKVLRVESLPIPEPGSGEIRVRVLARPINPSDILFIQGAFGRHPTLPSPAGLEGAGIIDAVGDGVSLHPGMRVVIKSTGTWQQYQLVKPHELIPIPARLDIESAAQFAINPLTAWLLLDMLQPNFDDWILVTAGTSAVSKMILRLGMKRGLRIISVVRRKQQVEALTALGAQAIIDVSTENIKERVESMTNGCGVSMAFDAVGGQQGTEILRCLTSGGRMVIYGLLSEQPITVLPEEMIFRQLSIESFWLAPRLEQLGSDGKAVVIEQAMNAFCDSDLVADVEQRYELGEVHAAVAHNLRPGRLGKILLVG